MITRLTIAAVILVATTAAADPGAMSILSNTPFLVSESQLGAPEPAPINNAHAEKLGRLEAMVEKCTNVEWQPSGRMGYMADLLPGVQYALVIEHSAFMSGISWFMGQVAIKGAYHACEAALLNHKSWLRLAN